MRSMFHAAVVLSVTAAGAQAQNTAAVSGWVPTLVVRPVPSHPDGARVSAVTGSFKLTKGEPASAIIRSGRSLCSFAISIGQPATQSASDDAGFDSAANVWKIA